MTVALGLHVIAKEGKILFWRGLRIVAYHAMFWQGRYSCVCQGTVCFDRGSANYCNL